MLSKLNYILCYHKDMKLFSNILLFEHFKQDFQLKTVLLFVLFIETKSTLFLTAMATARVNNSKPPKPKKPVDEESRAQNIKLFTTHIYRCLK